MSNLQKTKHTLKQGQAEPAKRLAQQESLPGQAGAKGPKDMEQPRDRYSLLEALPQPIVVYDWDGRVVYANSAFQNTFGLSLEELRGRKLPLALEEEISRANGGRQDPPLGKEAAATDQRPDPGQGQPPAGLTDMNKQLEDAISHAQRMTLEAELASMEMNQIFNAASDGMCVIGNDFKVMRVNEPFCAITGLTIEQVVGRKCFELLGHRLCNSPDCLLSKVIQTNARVEDEINIESAAGPQTAYIVTASPFLAYDGEQVGIVEGYKDITQRKELEKHLQQMATIDGLTGLYNRRHFMELLEKEIERARRYGRELTLVMMDIDHFKVINDTFGHPVGDKVLQCFSRACQEAIRVNDVAGRVGGEEFAVILVESGMPNATKAAERLLDCTSTVQVGSEQGEISFTVSIGLAPLRHQGETVESLIKRADQALYQAKAKGRNRIEVAE